tara:strand:+ start:129 stop:422 length:294 start_codon:yes stop_codon:yes gene_type:complete
MNFVKADGSSVTSFHTGEPAVGYNNKAKHLQGTMLGNFTNVPVGFESWGDSQLPYVPAVISTLFTSTITDSDAFTDPQRPGSGQLFPRGNQWSPSNT